MQSDKALIEVDGVPMISIITRELSKAGKAPIRIAVSSPEKVDEYGKIIDDDIEIEWILDAKKFAGPIEAILESLQDPQCKEIGTLQLCSVDVPWIKAEVFVSLEERLEDKDVLIMPHDGERSQPLLALIRPGPVLELLEDGQEIPLTEQFSVIPHSLLIEDPKLLKNVNRFQDLN